MGVADEDEKEYEGEGESAILLWCLIAEHVDWRSFDMCGVRYARLGEDVHRWSS
jgi:hypothetical protein